MSALGSIGLAQQGRTFLDKDPVEEDATQAAVIPDLAFVAGVMTLVIVADIYGRLIGELPADVESLSWRRNEYGLAKMLVPYPGTREQLIQPGNRLLIYTDNGLPPWAGVLEHPRRWEYGAVGLTAYGGEYLLSWRVTDRGRYFRGASAGTMFAALLEEQARPKVVEPGSLWTGGGGHTTEYHFRDLYDITSDSLIDLENADFDVSGAIENGRIVLRANFYERKGRDLAGVWLLEGHNATNIKVEEQGPIVNEWFLAGAGTGWGETNRIYATARDDASAGAYGLRQASEVVSDISVQATLDARASRNLEESKQPYTAISLDALNLHPAAYATHGIGDVVGIELYSYLPGGLLGTVKIEGREWRPRGGVCELVVV
jgi:hypothetical protein